MKERFLGVVLPLEAARAKACRVIGSCSKMPLLPHWLLGWKQSRGKAFTRLLYTLDYDLGIGVLQQV